jgi:glycine/serine hydroxymethyltransferase
MQTRSNPHEPNEQEGLVDIDDIVKKAAKIKPQKYHPTKKGGSKFAALIDLVEGDEVLDSTVEHVTINQGGKL